MKRSSGHNNRNNGKRYDKDRSQHMHPQHQYHNQNQHQHQQHQHNSPMPSNQQYYGGPGPSSHGMGGMGMYGRSNSSQSSYMYNNSPSTSHMSQRIWNYNVPPPQPVRPPLPRGPAPQVNPVLPPPPPQPADNDHAISSSGGKKTPQSNAGENDDSHTLVSMKPKRKSMSSRYGCPKGWVREDAMKAIALEEEFTRRNAKAPILLLRFPDPDLNRTIISGYCDEIESVHFQQNSAPRYCFVHLKEGADVDTAINTISKVPFGTGFVSAELKRIPSSVTSPSKPDEVDPYTLYIGNLPTTISSDTVKEHFPGAHRIDIGFAQRMKYTRYAFVRYDSVEKAMEAFKRSVNTLIESRSLIVRFRRQRSTVASGEPISKKDAAATGETQNKNKDNFEGRDGETTQKKTSTATRNNVDNESDGSELANPNRFSHQLRSPGGFGDTDQQEEEEDSKAHVFEEAARFRRQLELDDERAARNAKKPPPKRACNTLQDMFAELERRDLEISTFGEAASVYIKKEPRTAPEDVEPEREPVNLLGLRYIDDGTIKPEPEDEDDFPYDPHRVVEVEEDPFGPIEPLSFAVSNSDFNFDSPSRQSNSPFGSGLSTPPADEAVTSSTTNSTKTNPQSTATAPGDQRANEAVASSSITSAGGSVTGTSSATSSAPAATSSAPAATSSAPAATSSAPAATSSATSTPKSSTSTAAKGTTRAAPKRKNSGNKSGSQASKTQPPVKPVRTATFASISSYIAPRRHLDMTPEGIRRRELAMRDQKPTPEELRTQAIMRKIHNEVRNSAENVGRKRKRDDLDDLFARMNSDDDMDDFF